MSVGQEFRSEKNETSSRISVQQPTDVVGLFPFGLRSPGAAPKRLYAHAYSPEDIRAEFAREQKLLGRGGCQIEAKMKRDDRVL